MPARAALNVAYTLLIDGRDEQQRQEFEEQLHGWGADNDRANVALRRLMSGGDDDVGG